MESVLQKVVKVGERRILRKVSGSNGGWKGFLWLRAQGVADGSDSFQRLLDWDRGSKGRLEFRKGLHHLLSFWGVVAQTVQTDAPILNGVTIHVFVAMFHKPEVGRAE